MIFQHTAPARLNVAQVGDAEQIPFVSVIIPVFNDSLRLRRCLEALARQSYPRSRYEVVVVDNGSDEDIGALVEAFPGVVFGREAQPGSYAARNTALELARGDVLAFTDSDCVPNPNWVARGVDALRRNPDDGLVAGQVELFFERPDRPTSVELFESVTAFPQQKYVQKYHYGATANVFTWRRVFEQVGPFNAALKSGGDREWGQRVHSAGFGVGYANDAVVEHPARRSFDEMYRKIARVTGGMEDLRTKQGYPFSKFVKAVAKDLLVRPKDLAEVWRDPRLSGVSQRVRVLGVLLGLRYAQAWTRINRRFGAQAKR